MRTKTAKKKVAVKQTLPTSRIPSIKHWDEKTNNTLIERLNDLFESKPEIAQDLVHKLAQDIGYHITNSLRATRP